MITTLRVVPFIVTLGMLGIARGVAKWLAGEQTVNVPASWVNDLLVTFPKPACLGLRTGGWARLVLRVLAAWLLNGTFFVGRCSGPGSKQWPGGSWGAEPGRLAFASHG